MTKSKAKEKHAPKKLQEKAFQVIAEACKILEWDIAVPKRPKSVRYLIIGESKWIDKVDAWIMSASRKEKGK